jgi:hypothetical protein
VHLPHDVCERSARHDFVDDDDVAPVDQGEPAPGACAARMGERHIEDDAG